MHHIRRGSGRPLLLIHGLGSTWRSWEPILDALAAEREVIAVDLPGFGESPEPAGDMSIAAQADALEAFLTEQGLDGVDVVGSSMGARLALELARRGKVGATVALDPGGFWNAREQRFFGASVALSARLVALLQPIMPALMSSAVARTILLSQFSARPWRLPADLALREMRSFVPSPAFDAALDHLAHGPQQSGAPREGTRGPIVIGWGRRDRVCLPRQARRAVARFPGARLEWLDSGHFPQWDAPEETTRLILDHTA